MRDDAIVPISKFADKYKMLVFALDGDMSFYTNTPSSTTKMTTTTSRTRTRRALTYSILTASLVLIIRTKLVFVKSIRITSFMKFTVTVVTTTTNRRI